MHRSKKDVIDKRLDGFGGLPVFAHNDGELAGEANPGGDAADVSIPNIQGEGPMGNEADAESHGDEVDDEIEVIRLHHRLHVEVLAFEPPPHEAPGFRVLIE